MDIIEVFIITDDVHFCKADVIKIIKDERYKHNFVFCVKKMSEDDVEKYMRMTDETWCFGDCKNKLEYRIATELGADLWQMG